MHGAALGRIAEASRVEAIGGAMNVTTRSCDEIELWQLPADHGRYILLRFSVTRLAGTRDAVRSLRHATEPLALTMLQAQIDALGDSVPVIVHVGPGWRPSTVLVGTLGLGPAGV